MVHIEPMHLLLLRKVLQLAQVMKVYKVRLEQLRIKKQYKCTETRTVQSNGLNYEITTVK